MRLHGTVYGIYHPNYDNHVYRNITINGDGSEPFNRGHDDLSVQHGVVTVDGLTFENSGRYRDSIPLIQISDDNPTGKAVTHIRNLKVHHQKGSQRPVVNIGGGAWSPPTTPHGVPIYLHDHYGPGRHAKVVSTEAKDFVNSADYKEESLLTGKKARVTEVKDVAFPQLLDPVDDLAPTTVITHVRPLTGGKIIIHGVTADNGTVTSVRVNGREARALAPNFAQWEITLEGLRPGTMKVAAFAEDAAGNVEKGPHTLNVDVR